MTTRTIQFLTGAAPFALMAPDGVGSNPLPASSGAADTAAAGAPAPSPPVPAAVPGSDAPAAATNPAPAPEAPAAPPAEPSLLEAAKGKTESPPADAKPAEPAKPAVETKPETPESPDKKPADDKAPVEAQPEVKPDTEVKPQPNAAVPTAYDTFKVPDGLALDEARVKAFTEVVGPLHVPQDKAQALMDLHVAEIARVQEAAREEQQKHWRTLNDTWRTELRNDPELGGNRVETSLAMAKAVVEEYGGTKEQQAELMAHIRANGMGNYRGFVRLLHNIGQTLNVFEDKIVPSNASKPDSGRPAGFRRNYRNGNGATA